MQVKRTKTEGELLEDLGSNAPDPVNVPWLYRWTRISHYYGDIVREMLITCAILMLVSAPFYANDLKRELPLILLGAFVMVCVAALTSPFKRSVISADAITSGVGLVVFETWAMFGYDSDPMYQFVLRQAIALLFLFALYFSTKTLRSMVLRRIGQVDSDDEFTRENMTTKRTAEMNADWKEQAHDALEKLNEREKREFTD